MPPSTHEQRALKKSQHLISVLYSLCTEGQIAVIGLSPTTAPLWVMVSEHLSCQDSLSALRASIPLQFGLENPNLALEFCYSQSFQGFLLPMAEFSDPSLPHSHSSVPWWKNLSLSLPWVVNTRLLSQLVFLQRD